MRLDRRCIGEWRMEFQLTHPTRGATIMLKIHNSMLRFQLTHPTRGATVSQNARCTKKKNFNSHTPHGVRQLYPLNCDVGNNFNSHTPHGVRLNRRLIICLFAKFQLTHPTRGATLLICFPFGYFCISTHTPHTGCDGGS